MGGEIAFQEVKSKMPLSFRAIATGKSLKDFRRPLFNAKDAK